MKENLDEIWNVTLWSKLKKAAAATIIELCLIDTALGSVDNARLLVSTAQETHMRVPRQQASMASFFLFRPSAS